MNKKRLLNYAASKIGAAGNATGDGALSFNGMRLVLLQFLSPHHTWIISSLSTLTGFLAVGIEWNVYEENISSGLLGLFSPEYHQRNVLIGQLNEFVFVNKLFKTTLADEISRIEKTIADYKEILKNSKASDDTPLNEVKKFHRKTKLELSILQSRLSKKQEQLKVATKQRGVKAEMQACLQKSPFLQEYCNQANYINYLASKHHLIKEEKTDLAKAESKLDDMQKLFVRYAREVKYDPTYMGAIYTEARRAELRREISIKEWAARLLTIINIISSITCGIAYYQSVIALGVIPAAIALSPVFAIPVILFLTAISFITIYNTFDTIIKKVKLENLRKITLQNLKERLKQNLKLSNLVLATFVGIVIFLAVFVALATGSTWLGFISTFLVVSMPVIAPKLKHVLPTLAKHALGHAKLIFNIALSIVLLPFVLAIFVFNLVNGLVSTDEIYQPIYKFFTAPKKFIANIVKETINSFQEKTLNESMLQKISPARIARIIFSCTFRLLFFPLHLLSVGLTVDNFGKVPPIVTAIFVGLGEGLTDFHYVTGHNEKEGNHTHNHSHTDVAGLLIRVALVLTGVALAEILWHWGAGKLSRNPDHRRSLKECFKQSLFLKRHKHNEEKEPIKPVDSEQWKKHRKLLTLDEASDHYAKTVSRPGWSKDANKKKAAIATLRENQLNQTNDAPITVTQEQVTTLKKRRHGGFDKMRAGIFFKPAPTRGMDCINELGYGIAPAA